MRLLFNYPFAKARKEMLDTQRVFGWWNWTAVWGEWDKIWHLIPSSMVEFDE